MKEIPVYLFTGFLESGKTTYIQEVLEDPDFNAGEPTLLLVCEEGETEYEPEKFAAPNVVIHVVEEESELTEENVVRWVKEAGASRMLVEYNGMWQLDTLDQAMPMEWPIYQEFMFADAATFLNYNANMHPLVRDKLENCELVVFNRFRPDYDKMDYHKIVRAISRRVQIIYEDMDREAEIDEIEDPLPYDLEAPIVEIKDDDYAVFYRDLAEETVKYQGKTVRFKAKASRSSKLQKDMAIAGRDVMTCCVEDIRFAGLFIKGPQTARIKAQCWVEITARIALVQGKDEEPVPVLVLSELAPCQAPDPELASLY